MLKSIGLSCTLNSYVTSFIGHWKNIDSLSSQIFKNINILHYNILIDYIY